MIVLSSPEDEDRPAPLGPFQSLRVLGHGRTGVVHAVNDAFGNPMALKVPHDADECLPTRTRHVRQRIAHPRALVGLPVPGLPHALRFPLVDGAPLDAVRPPRSALPALLDQLTDVLEHLHQRDVVHRDIKPANLLLDHDELLVIDFCDAAVHPLSAPLAPVGTPAYMAPETLLQWSAEAPVDWYAVGVSFYELATGRLPFDEQLQTGLRQKQRALYPPIGGPHARWWNRLFHGLLEPHPRRRWRAPQIRQHLACFIGEGPRHAPASTCRSESA